MYAITIFARTCARSPRGTRPPSATPVLLPSRALPRVHQCVHMQARVSARAHAGGSECARTHAGESECARARACVCVPLMYCSQVRASCGHTNPHINETWKHTHIRDRRHSYGPYNYGLYSYGPQLWPMPAQFGAHGRSHEHGLHSYGTPTHI